LWFDQDGNHLVTGTDHNPFGFSVLGSHVETGRAVDPEGWSIEGLYAVSARELAYFSQEGYNFYGLYPDGKIHRARFHDVLKRLGWNPLTEFDIVFPHGFVLLNGSIIHLVTKKPVDPFGFAFDGTYVGLEALMAPSSPPRRGALFTRSSGMAQRTVAVATPKGEAAPNGPSHAGEPVPGNERWKIPPSHIDPFGFTISGIDPAGRRTRSGRQVLQSASASLQALVSAWEYLYRDDFVNNADFRSFMELFAQGILGTPVKVGVIDQPGTTAYLSWDTDPPTLAVSREFVKRLDEHIEEWVHAGYAHASGGRFRLPPAILAQTYAQLGTPARIASLIAVLAHEAGHARYSSKHEVQRAIALASGEESVTFSDGTPLPPHVAKMVPGFLNIIEDGRMERRVLDGTPQVEPYLALMNRVFDRTGIAQFPKQAMEYAREEPTVIQQWQQQLMSDPVQGEEFLRMAQRKATRLGLPIPQTIEEAVRQEVSGRPLSPFDVYRSLILHSVLPCYPAFAQERALIAKRYPDVMAALDDVQTDIEAWVQHNTDGTGGVDLVVRILDVARQHDLLPTLQEQAQAQQPSFSPFRQDDLEDMQRYAPYQDGNDQGQSDNAPGQPPGRQPSSGDPSGASRGKQAASGDPSSGDPSGGDPSGPSRGKQATSGDPSSGDPSGGDPSGPSRGKQATSGDPASGDPSSGDPSGASRGKQAAGGDPSSGDPSGGDPSGASRGKQATSGDPASGDPSSGDPSGASRGKQAAGGDPSSGDPSGGDTSGGDTDPTSGDRRAGRGIPRSAKSDGRSDPSFLADRVASGVLPYLRSLAKSLRPNVVGKLNHARPKDAQNRVRQVYVASDTTVRAVDVPVFPRRADVAIPEEIRRSAKQLARKWQRIAVPEPVILRNQPAGRIDTRRLPVIDIERQKDDPRIYARTDTIQTPSIIVGIVNDVSGSMADSLNALADANMTMVTALQELDQWIQSKSSSSSSDGGGPGKSNRRVHCAIMAHADHPGVVSFLNDPWKVAQQACDSLRRPPNDVGGGTVGRLTYDIMRTTLSVTEERSGSSFAPDVPRLMVSILDGKFTDERAVRESLEAARQQGIHTVGIFIQKPEEPMSQEDGAVLTDLFGDNQWVAITNVSEIPDVFGVAVARMLNTWTKKQRRQ
jgi:hypothetical protein